MAEVDHYAVLGVDPSVSAAELRRAFVAAARRHHPDRGGDPGAMRAVNEAWAVLGDPERRRRYDAGRRDRDRRNGRTGQGRSSSERPDDPPGDGRPPWAWWDPGAGTADADVDVDVDVDGPRGRSVVPPRRPLAPGVVLVPPGLFGLSIATGSVALAVDSPGLLGVAVGVFSSSCLAVAVVALLSLRGHRR